METMFHRLAWTATALFLSIAVWAQATHADDEPKPDEYYELMKVLVDSFEQIDRNYVKDVDRRDLVEAAVRGMLSKLDPYSDFISPEDLAKFTEAVEQEFGGVGIQVNFDREQRNIEVMTPFPGSPAYKAGIRAGDRIVEIEGKKVAEFEEGREIERAVELLKGEPGVEVTVGVKHPDKEEIETLKMTRDIIVLDTVLGDVHKTDGTWDYMLDDEQKIAYVRITHFTRRTASELRAALKTLRDAGMKGLVLDLRFNPGGLLQSAVEVCDLFIEKGVIVSTEGRNVPEQKWSAKPFGTFSGFPIAVLVNRYSASASEIVSACLQDHKVAVVVGERTWGKGSVQNVVELEAGQSALKLTTAAYHRPSGKNIHRFPESKETDEWGVMPDDGYLVKFSREETRDQQEDRAKRDLPTDADEIKPEFEDKQLQKALEYVATRLTTGDDKPEDSKAAEKESPPVEKKDAAVLPWLLLPIKLPYYA